MYNMKLMDVLNPEIIELLRKPSLSITEAGKVLGITRAAAYRGVRNGDIPTFKIGDLMRVPTHKVVSMLEAEKDAA